MNMSKPSNDDFNVWECKIIVPAGSELPESFDTPLRVKVNSVVEGAGIEVVCLMSGWGAQLTQDELDSIPKPENKSEIYHAGGLDADESIKH